MVACCFSNGQPGWYKWVVLVAACISQVFSSGYVVGTATLLSVFYQDRFQDRKLSAMIGSIQLAVSLLLGLPAVYLNKRFGERSLQVVGGALMAAGIGTTAFTMEAWQALLASGILCGIGAAISRTATYSATSLYFPGYQLVPYAALMLSFNLGTMILPPLAGAAMSSLGFTPTFLILAGLTSLNIFCGIVFVPVAKEVEKKDSTGPEPIFTLKIRDQRKGVYELPAPELYMREGRERRASIKDSTYLSTLFSSVAINQHVDNEETKDEARQERDEESADKNSNRSTLISLCKSPSVIIFLVYAFMNSFSTVAFSAIAGDYFTHHLSFTNDEFACGVTIMGVTSLCSVFLYLIFSHFFRFSSTFMQIFTTVSKGVIWLGLLCTKTSGQFDLLMGIYGALKSFGNMYACCMEIATPEKAVLMYMLELTFEGIGGTAAPFLATYLQVDVNIKAGFILAAVAILSGSLLFLPVSLKTFFSPKSYQQDEESVNIRNISQSAFYVQSSVLRAVS